MSGSSSELINLEALKNLYQHHPYLLLFQKEDWKDYVLLLQDIYNILEDDRTRVPIEVIKTYLIKYFSTLSVTNIDSKIQYFFNMCIAELKVLRDSHDGVGQRYIESTRAGKQLLQLIEGFLAQRVKYSGTNAETLLGALNDILVSRKQITEVEALEHHKAKIKAYQEDMKRIKEKGLAYAELLPIPHSNEALFNQAEESAIHILSSIEDVKLAIESERESLAQSYFEGNRSAGQSIAAVAEFYQQLYSSPEYQSYVQSKNLLSHIDSYSNRFSYKNVDVIVDRIRKNELLDSKEVRRSLLNGFQQQFQSADIAIQEKIKAQLKLLQQQVAYAVTTDVHGLQENLRQTLSLMYSNRHQCFDFFNIDPLELNLPMQTDLGRLDLFGFEIPQAMSGMALMEASFDQNEHLEFIQALLHSEETTLQKILEDFKAYLLKKKYVELRTYPLQHGLAEYYVISSIDCFDDSIEFSPLGIIDLELKTRHGDFVIRKVQNYEYRFRNN